MRGCEKQPAAYLSGRVGRRGSSVNIQFIIRSLSLGPIEQLAPALTICNSWEKARRTRWYLESKSVFMSTSINAKKRIKLHKPIKDETSKTARKGQINY